MHTPEPPKLRSKKVHTPCTYSGGGGLNCFSCAKHMGNHTGNSAYMVFWKVKKNYFFSKEKTCFLGIINRRWLMRKGVKQMFFAFHHAKGLESAASSSRKKWLVAIHCHWLWSISKRKISQRTTFVDFITVHYCSQESSRDTLSCVHARWSHGHTFVNHNILSNSFKSKYNTGNTCNRCNRCKSAKFSMATMQSTKKTSRYYYKV